MVRIRPKPPSDFPGGLMPIKRCSYGSNTTKPPSDFPGGLMPIKRCSYGSNMTKPPSDIVSCAQGAPMFELCFCNRLSLVPLIFPENSNLREIILLNRKFLNRILRASKLCGRQLSLEPDFKPESFFLSRKFSDGL